MQARQENSIYPKNRKEWRRWLEKHHLKKKNIWLVMYRKSSNMPSVTYEEAVEEALCFGWIDSRPNKRDAESFYLFFSQRKLKSVWSKLNKHRVEKLSKLKLIKPAGQKLIDHAKQSGIWNELYEIDNLVIPDDLKKALSKNKTALKYFNAFQPSAQKIILLWIKSAKQEATRIKRVKEVVNLAAKNIRANHYVKKDI
jgi:uncharacterized protein YdeI (YjbR/CyaY-like superfamily)